MTPQSYFNYSSGVTGRPGDQPVLNGCPQFAGPGSSTLPSPGLTAVMFNPYTTFDLPGDFTLYMWINPVSRSGAW